MRREALIDAVTRDGGSVLLATPSSGPASVGAEDTIVIEFGSEPDLGLLGSVLDRTAVGGRLVALVPWTVARLPVGRLVDVLARHGGHALAVVTVADDAHPTALLVERTAPMPAEAWIEPRGVVVLDGDQQIRLRAESVLGAAAEHATGLRDHAQLAVERRRADIAEATAARALADVARLTAEVHAVRGSRSYEVGQAFAEVRRAPVSGILRLPGRLRRAGKGSDGR